MRTIKKWWLVVLVLLVALGIRIYRLDEVPAGIYYDEIDLAYQARSLIETGRDYRGGLSPFFVRSFNTDKTPIPVWLSIPAVMILDTPALQVRATNALVGAVVVGLAMVLIWIWIKNRKAMVITGIVFALSPWLIQFSRIAFEAIFVLLFFFGFLIAFFSWLKNKKLRDFYLSIILLSLSVYVYRIMSFYAPLTFLMVGMIYFRDIMKVGLKHIIGGGMLVAVIILPFLYATTFASADQTRIEQVSIFSDPLVPIFVIRGREVDSGDYLHEEVGKTPVWYSYLFHNKPMGWMSSFKNNYMKSVSSVFLFATGDDNLRQGIGKTGALLWIDIVGLMAGLYWLMRNIKNKKYQLLAAWLVTAPIPADLTFDGAVHASRLIIFAGAVLTVVGLGWWRIFEHVLKWRWGRVAGIFIGVVYLLVFVNVAHKYFVHFPLEAARWHGYGYQQAMLKIKEIEKDYDKVMLTNSNDPAMLYYLFWAQVPPKEVQEYGAEFGPEIVKNMELDRVKMMSWSKVTEGKQMPHEMGEVLEDGVLYLITQQDAKGDIRPNKGTLPDGVKIIESVPYPDNSEVAYFLVTKE